MALFDEIKGCNVHVNRSGLRFVSWNALIPEEVREVAVQVSVHDGVGDDVAERELTLSLQQIFSKRK